MKLLPEWTDAQKDAFQKDTVTFAHKLGELDLFSDEGLIELLDKHPAQLLDVCAIGAPDHPRYPNKHLTVDFRNASGKDLLELAKAGEVFISIRNAMTVHPEYRAVRDEIYSDVNAFADTCIKNATGTILISSPTAKTPYHFDKKEVVLWHLRGQKRIYLYPLEEPFISNKDIEDVVSSFDDDLPYRPEFDDAATVIDLEPGQAISWPLNTPHRVDNSTFCVSINTEYSTVQSIMKLANMVTNATLRNKFDMNPSYANDNQIVRALKSVSGQLISRTSLKHDAIPDLVSHAIDKTAPNYLREIEPFERNF